MAMVTTEDAARRLARALASDVKLYNAEKLTPGCDVRVALAGELAEARELFDSRVAPALHHIFDDVAVASLQEGVGDVRVSSAAREAPRLAPHQRPHGASGHAVGRGR